MTLGLELEIRGATDNRRTLFRKKISVKSKAKSFKKEIDASHDRVFFFNLHNSS